MRLDKKYYRSTIVVLGIISGMLYSLWLLGYYLNRSAFLHLDVSALQSRGQPNSTFFVLGDIITGITVVCITYFIFKIYSKTSILKQTRFKLCLIGMVTFGFLTALSCLLPSCIASSTVCDASLNQVLDLHDITGGLAALGLFLSLLSLVSFAYKKISFSSYITLICLLISWTISGVLFVVLSLGLQPLAIDIQHIFLILSGVALAVIPITIIRRVAID